MGAGPGLTGPHPPDGGFGVLLQTRSDASCVVAYTPVTLTLADCGTTSEPTCPVADTPVTEKDVNALTTTVPSEAVASTPVNVAEAIVPVPHGPVPHPPLPQPVAIHQTSLMMAVDASAVGKMMVMSPADADLSAPKLNTATALSLFESL